MPGPRTFLKDVGNLDIPLFLCLGSKRGVAVMSLGFATEGGQDVLFSLRVFQ